MKKLFTLLTVVAFLAACGGNANKKAKAAEEEVTTAVECCESDSTKCDKKECCKDSTAVEEAVEAVPAE